MTAKQKKLFLLTSMMSVFVMAVAVLFTGGKLQFSPLNVRGSGETVSGSVTFTHFTNVNSIGQVTTTLANGGTVRAYSTKTHSNYDAVVSSTQFLFFDYVDNGCSNDSITVEGSSRSMAPFQSITGVKVTMSGTGTLCFNNSINGTSFIQTSITSSEVKVNVQGAKYCYFSVSGYGTRYLTSVTLYYSCSPDGGGGSGGGEDEPVGLSGTYTHTSSQSKFIFDDNRHGHFTYSSYLVYFTYIVDGSTFNITYESGDTACESYCIFPGGKDNPQTNTTGQLGTGWLKIQEYNENGGTTFSRTYYC